ncbi:MAG: response regulator, partial [Pseudorhodoplanes sp.]|nr:response regulator [Pseudorhodoplanes sp.]
ASRFPVDISETSDGRAALEMIARGAFDIVFLDYNMPGLNGVATLSELRRTAPCIKVVIMTSDGNPGVEERAREAGANAFLRKPFYPADVDAVLYGLFGLQPLAKAG